MVHVKIGSCRSIAGVAAIVAVVMSAPLTSLAAPQPDPNTVLMRQANEIAQVQQVKMEALSKRYRAIDVDTMLDPHALVTPEGRAASKAQLADYRKLADEMAAVQQYGPDQMERVIAALPPGEFKRGADAGFHRRLPKLRERITALRQAQIDFADSAGAIVEWCDAEKPNFGPDGKHLALTKPQLSAWRALFEKLSDAGKHVEDSAAALEEMHRDAQRRKEAEDSQTGVHK